ncbi:hypothetical protein [Qipengyuania mesophila]|uniref:hypothetical protein n=1 Tax=Qipengyuania mesophila TaxID=2867246 RepID=UPI0035121D06
MAQLQISELKSRFAISPLFDAEIEVGGMGLVALHPNVGHDLRMKVTAAAISHFQGYGSIDYVLKRYLKGLPEHFSRDVGIRKTLGLYAEAYDKFYRSFPPRSGERLGVFAFDLAFVRSHESIRLLLNTARQGFLIEPCLIARSLVEQYAYAVAVWDSDEDDIVFGTKPQSAIRYLKPAQPKIGQAYGLLSEYSHYHPDFHHTFIGEGDGSQVLQRCFEFKIVSLGWVFYVLDLQFRTFAHCYSRHESFPIVANLSGLAADEFDTFFDGVPEELVGKIRALF